MSNVVALIFTRNDVIIIVGRSAGIRMPAHILSPFFAASCDIVGVMRSRIKITRVEIYTALFFKFFYMLMLFEC